MRDDNFLMSSRLDSIKIMGDDYFRQALELWVSTHNDHYRASGEVTDFMLGLPSSLMMKRQSLESEITAWAAQVSALFASSPLLNTADQGELRISVREMLAALRFREYRFSEAFIMSWEDQAYGVQPASQDEAEIFPSRAVQIFGQSTDKVRYLLLLAAPDASRSTAFNQRVPPNSIPQRRDTAFIMMWMSEEHPELSDVKEAITEVFGEFGIKAIRADEIQHEDVITERIKQEISSAEFLIADLTGARPNVYYEVGYAHALGKRPILYRKKDTALHFDLAGINVPHYVNVSELKQKLRTRLEAMLGFQSSVSLNRAPKNN